LAPSSPCLEEEPLRRLWTAVLSGPYRLSHHHLDHQCPQLPQMIINGVAPRTVCSKIIYTFMSLEPWLATHDPTNNPNPSFMRGLIDNLTQEVLFGIIIKDTGGKSFLKPPKITVLILQNPGLIWVGSGSWLCLTYRVIYIRLIFFCFPINFDCLYVC